MKNIITRVMWCKKNHNYAKEYLVFGTTSQTIKILDIRNYAGLKEGLTPHIIGYQRKGSDYELVICCAVVGCGCSTDPEELINSAKTILVSKKKFNAILNFKDTGCELS